MMQATYALKHCGEIDKQSPEVFRSDRGLRAAWPAAAIVSGGDPQAQRSGEDSPAGAYRSEGHRSYGSEGGG